MGLGTKKRIGLLSPHNAMLKFYLPIIQVMFACSEVIPVLVTSTSIQKGRKSYQNYRQRFNPFHDKIEVLFFEDWNSLVEMVVSHEVDIIIANFFLSLRYLKELKRHGIKYIYLQSSFDPITYYPTILTAETYELVEGYLYYSDYYMQCVLGELRKHLHFNVDQLEEITKKSFIVGNPEYDSVSLLRRDEILKKYSIDNPKKKVVFFDPMFMSIGDFPNYFYKYYFTLFGNWWDKFKGFGKRYLLDCRLNASSACMSFVKLCEIHNVRTKIPKYDELFLSVRKYCDEQGYLLLIKSRPKNNDPTFISELCDYYFYDRSYFPFSLLEMLYISDAFVGFRGTCIQAAIYMNVPVLAFNMMPLEFDYGRYVGDNKVWRDKTVEVGDWYNYPGLTRVCKWNESVKEAIESIGDMKCDVNLRSTYVKKYFGFDDGRSSERILDVLLTYY